MNAVSADRLQQAVAVICSDVKARLTVPRSAPTESRLWCELCGCILSSQVPYELAQTAAAAIDEAMVLSGDKDRSYDSVATDLHHVLSGVFMVEGRPRRYRFPAAKSAQIARTWRTVIESVGSLTSAISGFDNCYEARSEEHTSEL